jgi:hypothetical protein
MNKRQWDLLALAGLSVVMGLFTWRFVRFSGPPAEDAAMLMRYADNLARGYGIVWNPGEPPVDGGTDFLFLTTIALVHPIP